MQDDTHGNRLKDLEPNVLVTTLFHTLAEVKENHDTLGLMQCQALLDNVLTDDNGRDNTLGDRLGNAQAKALTSALVTTPANVEKKTFADTMTDAADETEVHTLAVKLAELVAETVAIYYAKSRPIEWSMTS